MINVNNVNGKCGDNNNNNKYNEINLYQAYWRPCRDAANILVVLIHKGNRVKIKDKYKIGGKKAVLLEGNGMKYLIKLTNHINTQFFLSSTG